jgi:hypothetical protein
MAARFDEKLEPLGARPNFERREDPGGRLKKLSVIILLAGGLKHRSRSTYSELIHRCGRIRRWP